MLSVRHDKYDTTVWPGRNIVFSFSRLDCTCDFLLEFQSHRLAEICLECVLLFTAGRMFCSKRDPVTSPRAPQCSQRGTAHTRLLTGFNAPPACWSVILGESFQPCPGLFFPVERLGQLLLGKESVSGTIQQTFCLISLTRIGSLAYGQVTGTEWNSQYH